MPYSYGTTETSVATSRTGGVLAGRRLRVFTARNGSEITALQNMDGNLISELYTDADGRYQFRIDSEEWPIVSVLRPIPDGETVEEEDWTELVATELYAAIPQAAQDAADALEMAKAGGQTVTAHGADPTGQTNSRTAINAAITAAAEAGGGQVVFPPGIYRANQIQLRSNVSLVGYGATLTKGAGGFYAMFIGLNESDSTGYGSGPSNIRVEGFRFLGSVTSGISVCGFAMHHAQQVRIVRCTFDECQGPSGHTIDLGGCDQIVIEQCRWLGANPGDTGTSNIESIQIDYSVKGALSYDDTRGFDGLHSRGITVRDCEFLPKTVGDTTWPAPNPMGAHSLSEYASPEHLTFENNLVVDPATPSAPVDGSDDEVQVGVLHFPAPKHLRIVGNRFINTTNRDMRVISVNSISKGTQPTGSDPAASGKPKVTFATRNVGQDLLVQGNEFDGWKGPANPILIRGLSNGAFTEARVVDNVFRNGGSGTGATVSMINVTRGTVKDNCTEGRAEFVKQTNCIDVVVGDNPGA